MKKLRINIDSEILYKELKNYPFEKILYLFLIINYIIMKKLFIVLFAFLILLLLSTSIKSQDFTGTFAESSTSKVTIQYESDCYTLTFSDKGVTYATGKGYLINQNLYFVFSRIDKNTDGGYGIYKLNGQNIDAKHFNLDFSKRWSGVYNKE